MIYTITIHGCHDKSSAILDLTQYQLKTIKNLEEAINNFSKSECQPTISIDQGDTRTDYEKERKNRYNYKNI